MGDIPSLSLSLFYYLHPIWPFLLLSSSKKEKNKGGGGQIERVDVSLYFPLQIIRFDPFCFVFFTLQIKGEKSLDQWQDA